MQRSVSMQYMEEKSCLKISNMFIFITYASEFIEIS